MAVNKIIPVKVATILLLLSSKQQRDDDDSVLLLLLLIVVPLFSNAYNQSNSAVAVNAASKARIVTKSVTLSLVISVDRQQRLLLLQKKKNLTTVAEASLVVGCTVQSIAVEGCRRMYEGRIRVRTPRFAYHHHFFLPVVENAKVPTYCTPHHNR